MLQMIKELPSLDVPKKIRIKFTKGGDLIYISHLDLVRTMTRAIIRARIPVKYTEGYNPIPKLTFATPLSVGCSSESEYLDIKITRQMSCEDIKDALNSQLPSAMDIVDVYEPTSKFTDAAYSSYEIVFYDKNISPEMCDHIRDVFSCSQLVITKHTKSGEKQVDILPQIRSFDVFHYEHLMEVHTILPVSSADYLNPEYLVNIIYDNTEMSRDDYGEDVGYTLTRKNLLTRDNVLFK